MNQTIAPKSPWEGPERRSGAPPSPAFGELVVQGSWRPTDRPVAASDGWLRANGYAPDRRARPL
jgi:hypothetical protein